MAATPAVPGSDAAAWQCGGFAGAWRYQAQGARVQLEADVAAAFGLPRDCSLDDFLRQVDDGSRGQVASTLAAAASCGGRFDRRFRLQGGPAQGCWARLSGVAGVGAEAGALIGAITDLAGEGERMERWRDAEQRFQHAFDQTPTTAVQGYDRQRRVIYWNAASEDVYGYSREEALGRQLEDLIIPPPAREEVIRLHTAWVEQDIPIPPGEMDLLRKDGSLVPVFSSHVMLRNGWHEPEMYCIDVDLRPQRQAMSEGQQREHHLRLVSEASHVGWWEWDLDSDRIAWSDELARWLGLPPGLLDASREQLLAALPDEARAQLAPAFESMRDAAEAIDLELQHPLDGRLLSFLLHAEPRLPDAPRRRVGTLVDITESREAASRIDQLARFDPVTGLPNRLLMRERLQESIQTLRSGRKVVLACIGLDQFRLVNESFGLQAGDALLKACAERLQGCLRSRDTVVRMTGDRFGVLLDDVSGEADAETLARKLLDEFQRPFLVDEHELFLTASIGLSLTPDDSDQAEVLLQHAETALHRAKEQGRSHYQFFRAEMNQRSVERVQLVNRLRRAIEGNELQLHFQPQLKLADRSLQGAEALLRWISPQHGSVAPDRFIPLAEDSGLIEPIGDWVLARTCEAIRVWRDAGHAGLVVAANLSARQFRSRDLVAKVARELERCGVPPSALELEVTESVLLDRDGRTRELLFGLKDLGVSLAIDDFGTGYSSLSYLRRFPVDVLKIDRSFVGDLGLDADADALVQAIASMARALKLVVVAEGVETEAQASFLSELGCEYAQGWLFGRAEPALSFSQRFLGAG